jgi:hypothetical protein
MAAASRKLLEQLDGAKPIWFSGGHVRVDLPTVQELVADIQEDNPPGALVAAAAAVEEALRNARPVPLTDQVRLPREEVEQLAATLRAAGA